MRIAHFVSDSLGDIQKAHEDGIWQFGDNKALLGISYGDLVVISLKNTDRFFIVGFSASKVKNVTVHKHWPSEVDMDRANDYIKEIDITVFKRLFERTRSEVERSIGIQFTMHQGCCYKKEIDDISTLI